jgi:hypothetical protein
MAESLIVRKGGGGAKITGVETTVLLDNTSVTVEPGDLIAARKERTSVLYRLPNNRTDNSSRAKIYAINDNKFLSTHRDLSNHTRVNLIIMDDDGNISYQPSGGVVLFQSGTSGGRFVKVNDNTVLFTYSVTLSGVNRIRGSLIQINENNTLTILTSTTNPPELDTREPNSEYQKTFYLENNKVLMLYRTTDGLLSARILTFSGSTINLHPIFTLPNSGTHAISSGFQPVNGNGYVLDSTKVVCSFSNAGVGLRIVIFSISGTNVSISNSANPTSGSIQGYIPTSTTYLGDYSDGEKIFFVHSNYTSSTVAYYYIFKTDGTTITTLTQSTIRQYSNDSLTYLNPSAVEVFVVGGTNKPLVTLVYMMNDFEGKGVYYNLFKVNKTRNVGAFYLSNATGSSITDQPIHNKQPLFLPINSGDVTNNDFIKIKENTIVCSFYYNTNNDRIQSNNYLQLAAFDTENLATLQTFNSGAADNYKNRIIYTGFRKATVNDTEIVGVAKTGGTAGQTITVIANKNL